MEKANNIKDNNDYSVNYNFNNDKICAKIKNEKNKNLIEYYCNLLINISEQNSLNKIDYYKLLFSVINGKDKNYKYYIFQKIIKYIEILKENQKENNFSQFDEIIIKNITLLEEEKNYFYSLFLLNNKAYKNQKDKTFLKEEINNKIKSLIEEKQKTFEQLEKNVLIKVQNILKNVKDTKNNFDINEKYYAINTIWLNHAIIFLDGILNLNDNEKKDKLNEIFNWNQVYLSYFNKNNIQNHLFPGPIDNYYITVYKDIWIDPLKEDENNLIKNELLLNKDYNLIKEKDWIIIKDMFGTTNEIKRIINNLELFKIKVIIFDKRFIEHNKINYLKSKYIQIGKNNNIKQFKEKILRCVKYSFENNNNEKNINKEEIKINTNVNMTENIKDINDDDKYKIKDKDNNKKEGMINNNNICKNSDIDEIQETINIYKLSKKNKKLLFEIFASFINKIPKYESIYIEKINLKDDSPLELLFNYYDKSKDILLIEIIHNNSNQFFTPKIKNEKGLYQCSQCQKYIPLKNKYNCNICHMSLYCSQKCAESSLTIKYHIKLHEYLKEFINHQFSLNEFLKFELKTNLFNDGLVGLNNLGNTCFINASLQCLFNTYDLSKYFLSYYSKEEIYKKNKLGYEGIIAKSYGELLEEVKTTINSIISPINFIKTFFTKNKSLINGQQDAQEFLSLLLDSLHEDLNRITNKPYLELEEQKQNENDSEASKRWWDYYKKREDSIIIDLFHGQFKSKITCSKCKKSSITYEPFIFLGLPIPSQKENYIIIKFFFGDKCEYIGINIDNKTKIIDLKKKAIELMRMNNYKDDLSNDDLFGIIEIVQVDKNKIIRNICNNIHNFDFLFSLFKDDENLEIVLYEKNLDEKFFNIYIYPIKGDEYDISSYPIAFSVKEEMTFHEIIEENKSKIMSIYTNLHNDDKINVGLMHKICNSWLYYIANGLDSKQDCPLCDTEENYCYIYENRKIGDIFKYIRKKVKDYGPVLFVMGNSTKNLYNKTSETNTKFDKGLFFLNDCLKLFCEEEYLNLNNLWYCNKCQKHRIAQKQIRLYRLPIYLIIHLKKFKNNTGIFSASNEKKETFIKYPINNLNLSEYVEDCEGNKQKYDLYAVIQHHGKISQGHYTAICKINDKWYLFNDSKYFLIKNPITKDAYLLFYKKN